MSPPTLVFDSDQYADALAFRDWGLITKTEEPTDSFKGFSIPSLFIHILLKLTHLKLTVSQEGVGFASILQVNYLGLYLSTCNIKLDLGRFLSRCKITEGLGALIKN